MAEPFMLPTTKSALEDELLRWKGKYELAKTSVRNSLEANRETVTTVAAYGGAVVTGPITAAATGYVETRFPNKDGSMLSLGPIPLPLMVAGAGLGASFFFDDPIAKTQALSVTSSNVGLWAGTMGRGYGAAARLKKEKEKAGTSTTEGTAIGHASPRGSSTSSEWSTEERALLGLE
jgi:hypothetical protein